MSCLYLNIQAGCESEVLHPFCTFLQRDTSKRRSLGVTVPSEILGSDYYGPKWWINNFLSEGLWSSPGRNGIATPAFQPGGTGMDSRKTGRNMIPGPSCHAQHERHFLENKTQKKLDLWTCTTGNRAKNTEWDIFLGWWSASVWISSVGYGVQMGLISVIGCWNRSDNKNVTCQSSFS